MDSVEPNKWKWLQEYFMSSSAINAKINSTLLQNEKIVAC